MKRILTSFLALFSLMLSAQRPVNKLTLESTYSMATIHKSLRDLVDKSDKTAYFNDDFFISILKKILQDPQFSIKERTQLFYLLQKKIGYSFSGAEYLPPKLTYFGFHSGKIVFYEKVRGSLATLKLNQQPYFNLADTLISRDPILAGNAILLGVLLSGDSAVSKLKKYSTAALIKNSSNPAILNHYICMGTSILQDKEIGQNLLSSLKTFDQDAMLEDVLCAFYTKNSSVGQIREFILGYNNPSGTLCLETAMNILASKVPEASYKASLRSLKGEMKEKWKNDLCDKMLAGQIPFNYSLTSPDQVITKTWKGVTVTVYAEGIMVINDKILEFDPY